MSGQDETLRLVAEVVNKWSGPLRDMRNDLQRMSGIVKDTHARGAKHAREHAAAHEHLRKALEQVKEVAAEGVKPTLEALGVTSLTVAGAIAAVTAAVRGFAGSARELRFASRELGLSINQLRELDALSARIGSTPEAMRGGVATFARNMEQLRRHRGALQQFFASQHDVGVRAFGEQLSHVRDNAQALAQTLQFLDRIRDPQQRQNFLAALGLDPHLARLSAGELAATLADIRRNIGALSDDAVRKGLAAQEAFDRLEESIGRLKEEIGVEFAPMLKEATDAIRQLLVEAGRDGTIKALADDFRQIAHAIGAVVRAASTAARWLDRHSAGGPIAGPNRGLRFRGRAGMLHQRAATFEATQMPTAPYVAPSANGPSFWQRLLGAASVASGPGGPAQEETIKKGTERGVKSGLQQWYDGLTWTPISDQPGANPGAPGLQRYGGGRFAMFGPSAPGNAVRSALATPRSDEQSEPPGENRRAANATTPAQAAEPAPPSTPGRFAIPAYNPKIFDARRGAAMRDIFVDQLKREGYNPQDPDAVASAFIGNARGESNLDQTVVHDNRTGYGLFGHGRERMTALLSYLREHHYARDSAEGQLRFAAHEFLTRYPGLRQRGLTVTGRDLPAYTVDVRRIYESPDPSAAHDDKRIDAASQVYRQRRAAQPANPAAPPVRHFGLLSRARRAGVIGGGETTVRGDASVRLELNGVPRGARALANAGSFFKSIDLNRGTAMPLASQHE